MSKTYQKYRRAYLHLKLIDAKFRDLIWGQEYNVSIEEAAKRLRYVEACMIQYRINGGRTK